MKMSSQTFDISYAFLKVVLSLPSPQCPWFFGKSWLLHARVLGLLPRGLARNVVQGCVLVYRLRNLGCVASSTILC